MEDGCLRTRVGPEVKIREDLVSRETFRDFEMSIPSLGRRQYRRKIPGAKAHRAFQLARLRSGVREQLIDDNGHPDARRAERRTGAMYGHFAPAQAASRPIGAWNLGRIVLREQSSSIG